MIDDEIVLTRNFDEVQIVDDATEEIEIVKDIIKSKSEEDAFFIFDVGEVIQRHEALISKMPAVKPYYAVKCNPHPTIIKTLAALGTGFDCASKHEIKLVMASGVSGNRIILSNTVKPNSHIRFAKLAGVKMLTVDGELEMHKVKSIFPDAEIVIRFRCDAESSMVSFGGKFGCDAVTDAPKLINIAKDLGLNLHGFNFNVGTQCHEPSAYVRGIRIAIGLIEYAKTVGFQNIKLINIGGGFPSTDCVQIDEFADVINEAVEKVDPSIEVISEPGRYYVASAFTLTSFVLGKRTVNEGDRIRYIYHVNDGVFGSFLNSVLNIGDPNSAFLIPLRKSDKEERKLTSILGPTSFAGDCIVRDCILPELNVGDWLLWRYMGAYTLGRWRVKNRNDLPLVYSFVKRKVWEENSFLSREL